MKVRKHIGKIVHGLDTRNKQNIKFLEMSQKQIDRRIREVAEELDLEARGI